MSYYQTIFQLKYVKHTPPLTRDPILADLIDTKKKCRKYQGLCKKVLLATFRKPDPKKQWGPGGNRVESAALKVAIGGFRKIPRNQIMPLASKIPTDASVKEITLPCFLCRLHAKDCRFFSMKGNLFSSDIFMKTSVFFVYLQVIKPVVGLVYVVQNK